MSQDFTNFHFNDDQRWSTTASENSPFSGAFSDSGIFPVDPTLDSQLHLLDPSCYTFPELIHGSPLKLNYTPLSQNELFSLQQKEEKPATGETPATPNSSMSSSSAEAVIGDEVSKKGKQEIEVSTKEIADDGEETTKKELKLKKKGGKKERQPRYAFMTKSEIDHLEDGYKWRKYGQKAVKNSPFPRSYYRCTTQTCSVKKHIERLFHDPTIVMTTYEGQHNHHVPTTFRGNITGIFSHQMLVPSLSQMATPQLHSYDDGTSSGLYRQQEQQFAGHGLLEDILHSVPKEESHELMDSNIL